ncbi:MAG: O-antigen ligase family protein [Phycisphaerae bacterium]|nr:O-antigen ligase family protein [Phycisphaerae bacterium]
MRRLGIADEGRNVRCHMVIWLYYLAILVLWWDGSNFIIIEPRISVFMVVFGAAFAALLIAVLFGRQRIVRLPQLIPLLILAFWIVFTTMTAQHTPLAITALYTWFNRLLLAGTTAWVILTRVQVRRLVKVLIFACLVSALLMILQFTLRKGFVNPKNVERLVAGTSWRSAIVGFYMMAPMALMAAYAIFGRGTKRVSAGVLAVLFGLATLYSGTRSTFAGLMVVLAMLMLARPGLGRIRSIVLSVLLAVAVALVFSRVLPERTQRLMQKAEVARSDIRFDYLWPEAWRLFKEHPVLGIGPGGFVGRTAWSVHNSVLEMATEMGVLGCLLYSWLLAIPYFNYRYAMKRLRHTRDGWIWVGLYCGYPGMVVGTVLHGFGGWLPALWFLVGLSYAARNLAGQEDEALEPQSFLPDYEGHAEYRQPQPVYET